MGLTVIGKLWVAVPPELQQTVSTAYLAERRKQMAFSENVLGRVMASADPMICRDKGFALLKAGEAEESVEW